jgi:hypothetical protein
MHIKYCNVSNNDDCILFVQLQLIANILTLARKLGLPEKDGKHLLIPAHPPASSLWFYFTVL